MRESRQKKLERKFRIKWLIVAAIAVYCLITLVSQQSILHEQRSEQSFLNERAAALQITIETLKNKSDYISSDTYIERTAREKFGWIKQDEIVFRDADAADGKEQ